MSASPWHAGSCLTGMMARGVQNIKAARPNWDPAYEMICVG
jgi:hypothetical protein